METITYADYADDLEFLANTPAKAKSLLRSLEKASSGIGLDVNSDKTVHALFLFVCFVLFLRHINLLGHLMPNQLIIGILGILFSNITYSMFPQTVRSTMLKIFISEMVCRKMWFY